MAFPPSNIITKQRVSTGKVNVFSLDNASLLNMRTEEAILHVDLRDQMRKQFSNTEVDFFHIHYNLKMLDIKQLDRIYFQTSALPFYKSHMKKSKGSSQSDATSPLPPSHQTSPVKRFQGRNSSKFDENRIKSPPSNSGMNGHRSITQSPHNGHQSIPQSPHNGHPKQYDVVFGNSTDNNRIYLVYKHAQAHVIDDIHNLVLEKLKKESLVTCSPEPGNKVVICINKKWYRALFTAWPSQDPGSIVVKLVDLGRYVPVEKLQVHCYKVPQEISHRPLSFQLKVNCNDNKLTPGCIATIEQVNDQPPVEANIVSVLGYDDLCLTSPSIPTPTPSVSTPTKPLSNQYKISSRVNVTLNTPLTVLMLAKDGDDQWVQHKEFVNIYADWHETIESNITEFPHTPQRGEYCLKNYDYVWCRAIVTRDTPLTICYIDYGSEEVITNPTDLKPMLDMCLSYPPFGFKIKWVKPNNAHTTFDYEQEVSIIPVEVLGENCFKVLKEGESLVNIKYKDKPISRCGDNLVMNKPIEVRVQNKTNELLVGTTSSSNNNEYNNISIMATVDETHDISYADIEQDDYVLILDNDSKQWHRAQLVNQVECIFYLIDVGRSCESPKHLKSLFNNMWNLPPRYLYFKINKSLLKLCPVNSVIELLPLEILHDNTIACELVSSTLFALESPLPLTLNKEHTVYFANIDSVNKSVSYFFMDRNNFGSILFNLHQQIESSNPLSQADVGDYCGTPQEGEVFCRAKVLKVSGDKITVFLLDLGEIDIVSITDCKELPVGVYAQPPCIIKTNPLDPMLHLETQMQVTIIPRKEISRRYYSVNIVG